MMTATNGETRGILARTEAWRRRRIEPPRGSRRPACPGRAAVADLRDWWRSGRVERVRAPSRAPPQRRPGGSAVPCPRSPYREFSLSYRLRSLGLKAARAVFMNASRLRVGSMSLRNARQTPGPGMDSSIGRRRITFP